MRITGLTLAAAIAALASTAFADVPFQQLANFHAWPLTHSLC